MLYVYYVGCHVMLDPKMLSPTPEKRESDLEICRVCVVKDSVFVVIFVSLSRVLFDVGIHGDDLA